jgi:3-oxoacid CoA-transferase subunit A
MAEVVADVPDGITLLVPGFGVGQPHNLLRALYDQGAKDLTIVQNGQTNPSTDERVKTTGDLVQDGRVRKLIASFTAATHPSRASKVEQMVREGHLEVELLPQGTVAERIRAGGAGIPAFYTPASVGTILAEGKEHREFNGRTYVMEQAIFADYAFIHAYRADTAGNLIFRRGARNYNPIAAMNARHTFVEVETEIVPMGTFSPDEIHTPGVYVERMIQIPEDGIFTVERERQPPQRPAPKGQRETNAGSRANSLPPLLGATSAQGRSSTWAPAYPPSPPATSATRMMSSSHRRTASSATAVSPVPRKPTRTSGTLAASRSP